MYTEVIEALNQQLNREVGTFLRYLLQAASIRGSPNERIRQLYLEEVSDEVGHAQYLAHQIVLLGGVPKLEPDLTPPPTDVRAMLERDAEAETVDVKRYVRLAALADQAGLIALKLKMEEQAADEDQHGWEMRRLVG